MRLRRWSIPATGLLLTAVCGGILAAGNGSEAAIRQCIRVTAGSSLLLYATVFSASALVQLVGGERFLAVLQARRQLGLAFALSHSFHLAAIIALVVVVFDGDFSQLGGIVGGSVIYVLIYAMAATSNDWSLRRLGRRHWRRLHKVGGYAIWAGFAVTYIGRAATEGTGYYWLCSAIIVGVLLLRIAGFRSRRWRRGKPSIDSREQLL